MALDNTYDHCSTCDNKSKVNTDTGELFCSTCVFQYVFRTNNYKPKKKTLTLLAYVDPGSGSLFWRKDKVMTDEKDYFKRVPELDYNVKIDGGN